MWETQGDNSEACTRSRKENRRRTTTCLQWEGAAWDEAWDDAGGRGGSWTSRLMEGTVKRPVGRGDSRRLEYTGR